VAVVDTAANTVVASIPVDLGPVGVAVSPDGRRVYTTSFRANTVSAIDTATATVVSTIAVGKGPEGLAVNARCLFVANRGSNTVSAIRLDEPPVA